MNQDGGYWLIPSAIDRSELADLTAALDRYEAAPERYADPLQFQYEPDGRRVRKMRELHLLDGETWSVLWRNGAVQHFLSRHVDEPLTLVFCAAFLKPGAIGTRTPFHQDQALWERWMPQAFSCWFALDNADVDNGCLTFCPGSHLRGVLEHAPPPDTDHPEVVPEVLEQFEREVVPLTAGSAVAWDRLTVHGSGVNTSRRPRRGVVIVFAPTRLFDQPRTTVFAPTG